MRLAVLSDIHGNMDAFEAVLADSAERAVDRLVCLGDCVGYGAEPEAVLRRVRELDCPVVMGNHELALVHPRYLDWFNPLARRSLEATRALISDASHDFIAALPFALTRWGARFVHGFPPASPVLYLFQIPPEKLRRRLERLSPPLCFIGHTHRLEVVVGGSGGVERNALDREPVPIDARRPLIVNVGSVGQPRDGTPEAKYVIWDRAAARLELRRVPYPWATAADKIRRAGLPEAHAGRLLP